MRAIGFTINTPMQRLTDLRQILRYVPQFRDTIFVIALDGRIVSVPNFGNLLQDIALLRNLRINIVLVHGAGLQVASLAERLGVQPSNIDGTGVTDDQTMDVARLAGNQVSQDILVGLAAVDQRGAITNAIVAHPAGILGGVHQGHTGRVERIDTDQLRALIQAEIIPVLPPFGYDGEGRTYRLNSDAVGYEVARKLRAAKLIYLTDQPGVEFQGKLYRQLTQEEAEQLLQKGHEPHCLQRPEACGGGGGPGEGGFPPGIASKLRFAIRATKDGVPRVHIIDGRVQEGLLAEVFSKEGIGTLIHTNEYQAIRPATRKDLETIYTMLRAGMETDELLRRSRDAVERQLDDFFVFEVDHIPVACAALHWHGKAKAELASLYVLEGHENRGIGAKLISFIERAAREKGATELFCLSTQAINYFIHKAGFSLGSPDDLPPERRTVYEMNGRRSQVLHKTLS